jgi:hypothetical protein
MNPVSGGVRLTGYKNGRSYGTEMVADEREHWNLRVVKSEVWKGFVGVGPFIELIEKCCTRAGTSKRRTIWQRE